MTNQANVVARIRSKTDPSRVYGIHLGRDGVLWCECPSWKYQRLSPRERDCKHLKEARQTNAFGRTVLA